MPEAAEAERERHVADGAIVRARRIVEQQKLNALKWSARVLGPQRAALLASARLDLGNFRPGRSNVLCLTRPHFALDVEQLRRLDRVNWLGLNLIMLGEMQRAWAEPPMQQQTYYQRTSRDAAYAEAWSRMEVFAREVLQRICARFPIDALLCANIDYWQAEAFRREAARSGIPFLVLSRENLLTRYDERLILERYGGFRFEGDAVAVFGDWMRRALLQTGCVQDSQIVVTGAPRLDVWARAAAVQRQGDAIVLITFADPNYYAPEAFRLTLRRFLAAAARHRDAAVRFVIKAKGKGDALDVVAMGRSEGIPSNVEVTSDVSLEELLPRARLAIGFNSMAVFDALFTAAPVATPDLLDARRGGDYLMFEPQDDLCRTVLRFYREPDELDALLDRAAAGTLPPERNRAERRRLIERFVHLPEHATATEVVERFIVERLARAAPGRRAA